MLIDRDDISKDFITLGKCFSMFVHIYACFPFALIGRNDSSNDVITLGKCFSMFVYIRVRLRFALIGGNLTAQ